MFERLYGPVLGPKSDRLGTYAAALGYCFVLSLIPFLLVTFTLGTKITHLNLVQAYSDLIADILPGDLDNAVVPHHSSGKIAEANEEVHQDKSRAVDLSARILRTLQNKSRGGWATQIGFLFAVYTSFNLMTQIVRTLLFIFDDHRRPLVWTWRIALKTVALFGIWMFVLLLMAVCSIVTPVIEDVLVQFHLQPALWTKPLLIARDLVGMAALYGAFFLTYLLVPSKSYRLRQVADGSLVAMCGWVACSLLFAYVLPHLWHTNSVYEALGSVVIILLWAQACAWSVIAGACWMIRFPVASRRK
jgi:YihY family inner membrane protein